MNVWGRNVRARMSPQTPLLVPTDGTRDAGRGHPQAAAASLGEGLRASLATMPADLDRRIAQACDEGFGAGVVGHH